MPKAVPCQGAAFFFVRKFPTVKSEFSGLISTAVTGTIFIIWLRRRAV